jgi:hypothetical protein
MSLPTAMPIVLTDDEREQLLACADAATAPNGQIVEQLEVLPVLAAFRLPTCPVWRCGGSLTYTLETRRPTPAMPT